MVFSHHINKSRLTCSSCGAVSSHFNSGCSRLANLDWPDSKYQTYDEWTRGKQDFLKCRLAYWYVRVLPHTLVAQPIETILMLNPPTKLKLHTVVCRAYMINSLPLTRTPSHTAFSHYFTFLQMACSFSLLDSSAVCLPHPSCGLKLIMIISSPEILERPFCDI